MLVKHDKYSLEKQLHNGISCFLHSDFEKQKEDFCRASIRTTKLFLTQFFCSYCQQCLLWVKINRRPSVQAHIPHHSVSLSLLCLSLVTLTLIFLFSQFPVSWPGWAGSGHRLVAAGHATGAHCSHPTLNIPQSPVLAPDSTPQPVSTLTSPPSLILRSLDSRLGPEIPLEAGTGLSSLRQPQLTHMITRPRYRPSALAQPPLPSYWHWPQLGRATQPGPENAAPALSLSRPVAASVSKSKF